MTLMMSRLNQRHKARGCSIAVQEERKALAAAPLAALEEAAPGTGQGGLTAPSALLFAYLFTWPKRVQANKLQS